MPIKMDVNPGNPNQVRDAFDSLVSEMRANGSQSGILCAQSYNQMHWSANPDEEGFKKHGFIGEAPNMASKSTWSGRVHQNEGLTFEGFDGVIDVLGGDWQNAVYQVTLGGGEGPMDGDSTWEASIFSPAAQYLGNDGEGFCQRNEPAPWTIKVEGSAGMKIHRSFTFFLWSCGNAWSNMEELCNGSTGIITRFTENKFRMNSFNEMIFNLHLIFYLIFIPS